LRLNQDLRASHIQIAVGSLFSASGKYRNCLRLSYAQPFTDKTDRALEILGEAVERAMLCCPAVAEPSTRGETGEGRVSEKEGY